MTSYNNFNCTKCLNNNHENNNYYGYNFGKINGCTKANICLYKTLLNRCIVNDSNIMVITFDITLINKMNEKLFYVSLKDASTALQYACKDIKFELTSLTNSLIPLSNVEILASKGELLNVERSVLPPRSASRLIFKIIIKQEIECNDEKLNCFVNLCYNSITLNGIIRKIDEINCECIEEKIEPINICSKN